MVRRVHDCHELLKCATQPRRPVKSLRDDPSSTHRTTQPDQADQKVTQNQERNVTQSKPYLRRELQIFTVSRDRQMCAHDLRDSLTRTSKPANGKNGAFALKHSLNF
jgi:hypothetical protein